MYIDSLVIGVGLISEYWRGKEKFFKYFLNVQFGKKKFNHPFFSVHPNVPVNE